ncbi:FecR family protein [Halalkalibaculum sp. DA3122]|uniref:FecR family protein n=1 Tax=unclassified Halalkalibaculum TaxID=2964617 RepID=UPI0037550188
MTTSWLHPDYSLEELLNNDSFRNWTKGNASTEEKAYWDQWVGASDKNRKLALEAQKRLTGISIKEKEVTNARENWKKLEAALEKKPRLRKVEISTARRTGTTGWIWRLAAAVLVAAITGLSVYFYQVEEPGPQENIVKHDVKTDYGEQKTISLNDGSRITLNANSTLIYQTNTLDSHDIEVYLEGEAYFSVTTREGPDRAPFKVRTAAGQVEVLGTEFVVFARNSKTRVVLKKGSVSVDPLRPDQQLLLKPGQMAELDSSWETVRTKSVNPEVYTSWRTRILVFDRTPLAEVIERLEYTFGVNVIVREPDLFKQKITGSIENAGLEVITSALSRTVDTSYRISGDTVYLGK